MAPSLTPPVPAPSCLRPPQLPCPLHGFPSLGCPHAQWWHELPSRVSEAGARASPQQLPHSPSSQHPAGCLLRAEPAPPGHWASPLHSGCSGLSQPKCYPHPRPRSPGVTNPSPAGRPVPATKPSCPAPLVQGDHPGQASPRGPEAGLPAMLGARMRHRGSRSWGWGSRGSTHRRGRGSSRPAGLAGLLPTCLCSPRRGWHTAQLCSRGSLSWSRFGGPWLGAGVAPMEVISVNGLFRPGPPLTDSDRQTRVPHTAP